MNISQHVPAPPLDRIVDFCLYYSNYTPGHSIERVVPDGGLYVIFELDGIVRHTYHNESLKPIGEFSRCWVSGMHRSYISISAHPASSMFAIRFRPGGARPILHVEADTLNDRVLPGHDVVGESILELREQLRAAGSAALAFSVAETWLLSRYDERWLAPPVVAAAVSRIEADPPFATTSLLDLVRESGYSRKQFIHLFKKYVGLTPKYLQRIMRFNEILKKITEEESISWSAISYQCGYFDQAHFVKEFKEFSGRNPRAFLEGLSDNRTNFFPVD